MRAGASGMMAAPLLRQAPLNFMNPYSALDATPASVSRRWIAVLLLCLLLRLLTLPLTPLTDHTEARYAEIARLMLVLQDWVSPHITPEEVFWAKPPLATWGQALAMQTLGVSAWAARLPAVLWSLGCLAAFGWMLGGNVSALRRWVLLAALALCPLFFVSAGAVMTDMTLAASVMLVQAAWWRLLQGGHRREGWLLAAGLGLALLTKGPAAAALALLPIILHASWRRHWGVALRLLRDPLAWLIWLAMALPWYVAAELKTPGFLEYFVLGEHVMRFLQPGWKGDRYGFAHAEPLGIIWVYALLAALPVMPMLLATPWLRWKQGRDALQRRYADTGGIELACYAMCIALAPLLLFSPARNLIWTYAMTALPGLVLLGVGLLPEAQLLRARALAVALAWLSAYAWAFCFKLPEVGAGHSDAPLIAAFERACAQPPCGLRYAGKPPYSAYFYTAGRLYQGMPAAPGHEQFKVEPRPARNVAPAGALACNKEQCLLREFPPLPADQ